jgi:sugar phosphate isomerase/epimerase
MELYLYGGPQANASLDSLIRAAAQAGFESLNLWAPGLEAVLAMHPVSWLDDLFQQHALYPAAISGLEPLHLRPRPDYVLFQSHFVDLCAHLDALGGGIVVICLESSSDLATTTDLVHALQRLSDLAAPFDVRIAARFDPLLSHTPGSLARIQEIATLANRHNVGIALDAVHAGSGDESMRELDALLKAKLWLVDLQDINAPNNYALGKKVCRHLADKEFRGPYSIELVCQENQLEQAVQATRKAALTLFQSQSARKQVSGKKV